MPVSLVLCVFTVAFAGAGCRNVAEPQQRDDPGRPVRTITVNHDTLVSAQDTYVRANSDDKNYGAADSVMVWNGPTRALVAFSQAAIDSVVGSDSLVQAVLRIRIKSVVGTWGTSGSGVNVLRVTQAWTELGATWNCAIDSDVTNEQPDCATNAWSMDAPPFPWATPYTASVILQGGESGWLEFDVTADVRAFIAGTTTNYGWILKKADESLSGRAAFRSREHEQMPRLVIRTAHSSDQVPVIAPDTTPAWVNSGDSIDATGQFVKNVVMVMFADGATQAQRQAAVDLVGATVIGGIRVPIAEGIYLLYVPGAGSITAADSVMDQLLALPQVATVALNMVLSAQFRRPNDGADWSSWNLYPDSIGPSATLHHNWPLEAINAPMAWGCSVGDTATRIAVLDHVFDSTDLVGNFAGQLQSYPGLKRHGAWVTSALAARGDNNTGITGTMWRAHVEAFDFGTPKPTLGQVLQGFLVTGQSGVKIVNLSYAATRLDSNPAWIPDSSDTTRARRNYVTMDSIIRHGYQTATMPLFVIAAGDEPIDAYWGQFAGLKTSFPDNILVVGGSTRTPGQRWLSSSSLGSAVGNLIDIFAPGDSLYALDKNGETPLLNGTSISAAYVSGVAGLLLSFDPRLTAVQLKSLIDSGAARGGRLIPRGGTSATSAPLLNAYESLLLAARNPGAPLCGNRIWVEPTGELMVDRVTSDETLVQSFSFPQDELLTVEHGGRTISRCTYWLGTYCVAMREFTTAWGSPGSTTPYESNSPGLRSFFGVSHDGDSLVAGQKLSTTTHQLYLQSLPSGSPVPLGSVITIPNVSNSVIGGWWNPRDPELLLVYVRTELDFTHNLEFHKMNRVTGAVTNALFTISNSDYYSGAISENGKEFVIKVFDYSSSTCRMQFRDYSTGNLKRAVISAGCDNGSTGTFAPPTLSGRH